MSTQATFTYNLQAQRQQLQDLLAEHLSPAAYDWLKQAAKDAAEKMRAGGGSAPFRVLFSRIARKISGEPLHATLPGSTPSGVFLPADRQQLARLWVLLQVPPENREGYLQAVGDLFRRADMRELVALYTALPLLAYPEDWIWQCTEGIRSNIDGVLKAVMLHNPYPAEYLPQGAWNQLILKAFFTDQDLTLVSGEPTRRNPELALALKDYRDERLAAGRPLHKDLEEMIKNNETK